MKDYSVRRMRAEFRVTYRLLAGVGIAFLVLSSVFGALTLVLHEEGPLPLVVPGVFFATAMLCLGAYLRVTDPGWLVRHSCYGKALSALGEAEALMEQLDREALHMDYEAAMFALMPHWLVLYDPSIRTGGVESLPIPRHQVQRLAFERDTNEENSRFAVRVDLSSGVRFLVYAWGQADIEALRQWGATQEIHEE